MPHDLRLRLHELALTGMRLGRHIDHDLRSAAFKVESVWEVSHPSRPVTWIRRVPVFDQGDLGSCTGTGINWYSSFDEPGRHGLLAIADNAYVRGGHELEILSFDPSAGGMLRGPNSWGTSWGDHGYWEMSLDTFGRLRAEHADVTVPVRT